MIRELENKLRDIVNEPRSVFTLMKDRSAWNQLCSCMDMIGDTELAIDAYMASQDTDGYGARYLRLFGVLQALILQQDAIQNLAGALKIGISIFDHPRLLEVREIRNASIGHPTKQDRRGGRPTAYNIISRPTLNNAGFQLLSFEEGVGHHSIDIDLFAVIEDQHRLVMELLQRVIDTLERAEAAHKEEHKMNKLTDLIPDIMNYQFEKLYEGVTDETGYAHIGRGSLQFVKGVFERIRKSLEERDSSVEAYPGLESLYDQIEYPLSKLESFYEDRIANRQAALDPQAASIFISYLATKVEKLRAMAQEIDDEYEGATFP